MCPSVYIEGGEGWGWKLSTQGRSAFLILERVTWRLLGPTLTLWPGSYKALYPLLLR